MAKLRHKQQRMRESTTEGCFSPSQSQTWKVCFWKSFKHGLGFFCTCWTLYILYLMLTTHPCLQSTKCLAALMAGTDTSNFSIKNLSSGPTKMAQSNESCYETVNVSINANTTLHNIVFELASSAGKWNQRKQYVELWWKPEVMRGHVWLDKEFVGPHSTSLPPLKVSEDTSRFRYTFKKGLRSAIRISRIVSEAFRLNISDVHWFVMGDDDTVFFPENLLQVLSKYDHNQYYYIGSNSESVEQNVVHSYGMAFGGGGFAISYPLAKALEKMQDSCLDRYSYLYGSDARIHACLADLGVPLTKEPGFHQVDFRGNILGWLSAHPLTPLVSLHHLDAMAPIFPNMNQTQAFQHLFKAVKADSSKILQQAICYDKLRRGSFSVSWGYSIHVFDSIQLPRELEYPQKTFMYWRKTMTDQFMFNTRDVSRNPCERPAVFFYESVSIGAEGINTSYIRQTGNSCPLSKSPLQALKQITVLSTKSQSDWKQAPRRHCCDILTSSSNDILDIHIRSCMNGEVIYPE
uniref:Uncharacterized protein n=1 Tax=Araucaria cunninghamii TaxID=56994 RepID=A0A0D6R5D6_ARACU